MQKKESSGCGAFLFLGVWTVESEPACEREVHAMGQLRIVGEETVAVAEYAGVTYVVVELVGNDIAVLLDNLELGRVGEFFNSIFHAVYHLLQTQVGAKAIGVDSDKYLIGNSGDAIFHALSLIHI